jgi:hypothetical protein
MRKRIVHVQALYPKRVSIKKGFKSLFIKSLLFGIDFRAEAVVANPVNNLRYE